MEKRPDLNSKISPEDFLDFYWLKEELTAFCRTNGLSTAGKKKEITDRITHYLKTGEKLKPISKSKRATSNFDWANAPLTSDTIITDNYKNCQNVRHFFQQHTTRKFSFNIKFMDWMKTNVGKTLGDAIEQWEAIQLEMKNRTAPKVIPPSLEYNTYIRDFLADNPSLQKKDAIHFWKIKKALRGTNLYERGDLEL